MKRTIISIWPMEQKQTRPRLSPQNEFILPAAPFDGFVRLTVTDMQEHDYMGGGRIASTLVPASELAEDLAKAFSSFSMGDSGAVGVWVADREDMTDDEIKSSDRYKEARAEQDRIMHNIVVNARYWYGRGNESAISAIHHTAAAYLNIAGEDWQGRNTARSKTKECPFCHSFIASGAVICPTCTQIIDADGYAKLQAQIKARVDAISQQQSIVPDNGGSALRPALAAKGK